LQTQSHATTAYGTAVIGCRPWHIITHCNTQLKVQAETTAINHCKNNVQVLAMKAAFVMLPFFGAIFYASLSKITE
jgi:hypothetical protein